MRCNQSQRYCNIIDNTSDAILEVWSSWLKAYQIFTSVHGSKLCRKRQRRGEFCHDGSKSLPVKTLFFKNILRITQHLLARSWCTHKGIQRFDRCVGIHHFRYLFSANTYCPMENRRTLYTQPSWYIAGNNWRSQALAHNQVRLVCHCLLCPNRLCVRKRWASLLQRHKYKESWRKARRGLPTRTYWIVWMSSMDCWILA